MVGKEWRYHDQPNILGNKHLSFQSTYPYIRSYQYRKVVISLLSIAKLSRFAISPGQVATSNVVISIAAQTSYNIFILIGSTIKSLWANLEIGMNSHSMRSEVLVMKIVDLPTK